MASYYPYAITIKFYSIEVIQAELSIRDGVMNIVTKIIFIFRLCQYILSIKKKQVLKYIFNILYFVLEFNIIIHY